MSILDLTINLKKSFIAKIAYSLNGKFNVGHMTDIVMCWILFLEELSDHYLYDGISHGKEGYAELPIKKVSFSKK